MLTSQAPLQLNSLTGTYATSAYVAALKQSTSELEKLAEDVSAFGKTIKSNADVQSLIRES
jgi:F-type H+-transporting ATPase subunit O